MSNVKRFAFPVMWLFALVLLPGTILASKTLYKAKLQDPNNSAVRGSSVLGTAVNGTGWDYMVYGRGFGGPVDSVWLADPGLNKAAPLCGYPGGVEAECTYDASGNLDLSGTISSGVFATFNWRGSEFKDALDAGRLEIRVYYGSNIASGAYSRVFP